MTVRGTGLGFHFEVSSPDADLETFCRSALRHLPAGEGWQSELSTSIDIRWTKEKAVRVEVGGREVFSGEAAPALARAMNVVNVGATRAAAHDPVMHCGVLLIDGTALLLPGRPGAGKSTTTTALLLRGYGYLSDEAAPITPDGLVRPYPKPVVIGRGSWPSVPAAAAGRIDLPAEMDAWWLDPERLGCAVQTEPVPVGAVVAPQYRAGAPLSVERMSRAEATTVMASNSFNMHEHGVVGVERTAAVTGGIPLLRLTFSDVDEVCDLILEEVGG